MAALVSQPCDEAVVLSKAAATPCKKSAEPWVLTATILGSSMAFIDGTVVNVALPALQRTFNASVVDAQWVVESYALFLSALLLVGGSLGDRFGRKKIYAVGTAVFAVASCLCGISQTVQQLIVSRALQGVGAALLVPGSLAIISASFAEERRGKAFGTWSGFTSITAAIGPVLGGWLIENFSWRAAFFINAPIAAAVLYLLFRFVPESRDEGENQALDWKGALIATIGLGSLVYGLIESAAAGFTEPRVFLTLVIGVLLLIFFLWMEIRTEDPMLPLILFRSRNFTGTNMLTLLLYAALSGALFFYPLNLIQVQGYSATAAGASLLPFILTMFVLSRWSGGLVQRYGSRIPLVIGPAIAGLGFALFAVPGIPKNYWTSFFPAVMVLGLGMSISVAPLTTTIMNSVKQSQAGIASGINNAVSRAAGLLSIAAFGILMLQVFGKNLDQNLSSIQIPASDRSLIEQQRVKLGALTAPATLRPQSRAEVRTAVQKSFVAAFRVVMILSALLAVASAVSAWLMITSSNSDRTVGKYS